jgi:hypothetical protein
MVWQSIRQFVHDPRAAIALAKNLFVISRKRVG